MWIPSLKRTRRTCVIALFALLSLTVFLAVHIEEQNYGVFFMWRMNYYSEVVRLQITVKRNANPPSIAIAIILQDETHDDQYALASSTVRCYAALHGYRLHVVNAAANKTWAAVCPQPDFMFHRHCVLRHLLDDMDEEWIFFLDADVGVIYPNHLLEEYLPSNQSTHVVFYDRIMNHEVAAGNYIVRNSAFSRRFLRHWADAFYSLPDSWQGTDNGALHFVLLQFAFPELQVERGRCEQIWKQSTSYYSLDNFVVCTRSLMAGRRMEGVEIRNKRHPQRWCRDGWLTESMWSRRDFMLHGWQKRRQDVLIFARWHSPLVHAPGASLGAPLTDDSLASHCAARGRQAASEWAYKDSFMGEEQEVQIRIEEYIEREEQIYREKAKALKL